MHKLCEGVEATCQRPVPVPLTGESLLKALPHIGDCIMRLVMLTSVHAVGLHPQGLQLVQRDVMSEEAALERWQGHLWGLHLRYPCLASHSKGCCTGMLMPPWVLHTLQGHARALLSRGAHGGQDLPDSRPRDAQWPDADRAACMQTFRQMPSAQPAAAQTCRRCRRTPAARHRGASPPSGPARCASGAQPDAPAVRRASAVFVANDGTVSVVALLAEHELGGLAHVRRHLASTGFGTDLAQAAHWGALDRQRVPASSDDEVGNARLGLACIDLDLLHASMLQAMQPHQHSSLSSASDGDAASWILDSLRHELLPWKFSEWFMRETLVNVQ